MADQKSNWWITVQKIFKARGWLVLVLILLAGWSAFYFWKHPQIKVVETKYYYPVPGNTQVIIKEKNVPVDHIVIIEKPGVPNLPEDIQADTNKQVTAVGTVPSWEGNTSVAAIINLGDGKTTLYQKQEPLPFVAFRNKGYLDVGWGLNNWKEQTSGKITWEYVRIGPAVLWMSLEQNSRPETIIMTGARIPLW